MNKLLKIMVLPIIVFFACLGTFGLLSNNTVYAKSTNTKTFEEFSSEFQRLITNYETGNSEEISFSLNNELINIDDTFMVKIDTFKNMTGVKIFNNYENEYTIKNSETSITLTPNDNVLTVDNDIHIVKQPAKKIDNDLYIPIEDISRALGYTLKFNENKLFLSRPYTTKRVIVKSNAKLDNFGAVATVEGYNDLHIFQYATEKATIKACDYFDNLATVDCYQVDNIIKAQNIDNESSVLGLNDSFSYTSWGAESMGVESYSNYLINTIGTNSLNEVVVAVLDTGIDTDHSWFTNRIANGGKNFSTTSNSSGYEYEDGHGHGTHVSGIICDLTLSNVKILPVKVLNDQGFGYTSSIVLGLGYLNQLKQSGMNICAVNLSLGGLGSYIGSSSYNLYFEYLTTNYTNNILPIVAAGNEGTDASGVSPANVDIAITVSAVGKIGSVYYRPTWSNYGSLIDVSAPGCDIVSAKVGGGTTSMSGTSMATPHVTATVALLMSDSSKNYTIAQIERIFDENAIDLGSDGWDEIYGEGLVNIEFAYAEHIDDVVFSETATYHSEAFNLTLSTTTADSCIYYTTDGSIPTTTNGTLYLNTITVNETQRIKARAFVVLDNKVVKCSRISQITYCVNGEDIDNCYVLSTNGTLVAYTGILKKLTVPSVIGNITIRTLGEKAFSFSNVESVTLPSTVESIGLEAFINCKTIECVYGPSVKTIDMKAFKGCTNFKSLTDDHFPILKYINKQAFEGCYAISTINLSNLVRVEYCAFNMDKTGNSVLTSITLPNAIVVGDMAFLNCNKLATINIPNVQNIGSNGFRSCNIENISLPSAKYIGTSSFYANENLLTADMPEALVIGSMAFYCASKLYTVNIPKAQKIGSSSFRACSALENIAVGDYLVEVNSYAFNACKLTKLDAPKLRYVGRNAFAGNQLTYVNIPSVVIVEHKSFDSNSSLATVYLSSCIESINLNSFGSTSTGCRFYIYSGTVAENFVIFNNYLYTDLSKGNELFTYKTVGNEIHITGYTGVETENLMIPSYINSLPVTKICKNAFSNFTNIRTLNVSYLREIEDGAFEGCLNLEEIILDRIEIIGANSFKNCVNLNKVEISNVYTIKDYAFYGCSNLTEIEFSTNITKIGIKALGFNFEGNKISTFIIYGYYETEAKTYADTNKFTFNPIFNDLNKYYYFTFDNNGTTELGISLVDSYITGNIIIPSRYNNKIITRIGAQAFKDCCFITGITLPETITVIEADAFYGCTALETINLDNVKVLEEGINGTFGNCTNLKYVSLPKVSNIPASTFKNCEKLLEVEIPQVKTIKDTAFFECYSLRKVVCPLVEEIGWGAFAYNEKLEQIDTLNVRILGTKNTLSDGSTVMNGQIFSFCESLKQLYLPKIVTMGFDLFSCSAITKIVIGKSLETYYDSSIPSFTTIYGYSNTLAEKYAKLKNNTFIALDEFKITTNLFKSVTENQFNPCSLSVDAIGFDLKYQWFSTTLDYTLGCTKLDGKTSSTLDIDSSIVATNKYFVIITNWDGTEIRSEICTVTINQIPSYIITAHSSDNGTITPSGNVDVHMGENKNYIFTANKGYYISAIYIDNIGLSDEELSNAITNGYTFTNISSNHTIRVEFSASVIKYTVKHWQEALTTEGATLIDDKYYKFFEAEILHGKTDTFTTASARTYAGFTSIAFEQIKISASEDSVVNIFYTRNSYALVLNGDNGISYIEGNGTYLFDEEVKISAKLLEGYSFVIWKSMDSGFNDITELETTFKMPSNPVVLTATANILQYVLTIIQSSNGTISSNNTVVDYNNNATIILTPDKHYHVESLVVDGVNVGAKNTYTLIKIKDNHTITATFAKNTYSLNINNSINGEIHFDKPISNINEGDTIIFTIVPKPDYALDYVLLNGNKIFVEDNSFTLTNITADMDIDVVYSRLEIIVPKYNINLFIDGQGSVTSNKSLSDITCGEDRVLNIITSDGWELFKVYVNGVCVDVNNNTLKISSIEQDKNIQAIFKEKESNATWLTPTTISIIVGTTIIATLLIALIIANKKRLKQNNVAKNSFVSEPRHTNSIAKNDYKTSENQSQAPTQKSPTRPTPPNSILNQAINFAQKNEKDFISFCNKNDIDYKTNYNIAVLKYYQAHLNSSK